jgi:hypothetical protein
MGFSPERLDALVWALTELSEKRGRRREAGVDSDMSPLTRPINI